MAKTSEAKPSTKSEGSGAAGRTKIRRIKASNTKEASPKKIRKIKDIKPNKSKKLGAGKMKKERKFNAPTWLKAIGKPFFPIGRYVRGAWQELRVTKWPNRRATWSLTVAVLLFAAFFAVLILVVDYGFEWIMKEIIL